MRSRYTRPRDRGSRSARDQQAKSAASWRAWWQQEILRVHEQAGAAGASRVQADVLRFALEFESEDPVIRALAGEARYGEGAVTRWILLDTERALAHRAAFLETAREAARNVGPARRGRPRTEDRSDRVAWPTVLEGETVRVLGAASPEELQRHLEVAESAAAVFSKVFGVPARLPSGEGAAEATFPLYVTTTRAQGNAFLATEPGVGGEALALLASLDVAFLPKRPGAVVKTAQDSLRLEATVHAVQAHLTRPHLGHEPGARGAWAQEAVALYLAWLQVRTRELCTTEAPTAETGPAAPAGPFGRPRHDAASGPVQVGDAEADWHARAAEAIRISPSRSCA